MVQTEPVTRLSLVIRAFTLEEREFLLEMVEPELSESVSTLAGHNTEELVDMEDLESWTNTMGRQKRRLDFIKQLHGCLERSLPDD